MLAKLFLTTTILIGICADNNLEDVIKEVFNIDMGLPDGIPTPKPPRRGQPDKPCGLDQECTLEYRCLNGHTNTDGATLINVRFDVDDPKECPFLQTCCATEDVADVPIIKRTITHSGCGYRNPDGVGIKIEGGTSEAEFGEFPWMLAILRGQKHFDDNLNVYQCGGSLIHPQVALTTAHCVQGKPVGSLKVRAGEWETNNKNEIFPDQDRQVADIVIHENFNSANLHFDFALLFLEKPFDLAPNVNTVCLPPVGYNFDFSRCYAAGWGKDQFQNGQYQNILKKLELPTVPSYVCQDALRQTRLGSHFQLHFSFMCAGGERKKDTCEGDGGSPLVCPIPNTENQYYQAGMVAWGIGCGDENVPGVYANVAEFRSWIDEHMAQKNFNTSSYIA